MSDFNQGLKIFLDKASIAQTKQEFDKLIKDLETKAGKGVQVDINESALNGQIEKATIDINGLIDKYKELGKVQIAGKTFDPKTGELDSLKIKLTDVNNILHEMKYQFTDGTFNLKSLTEVDKSVEIVKQQMIEKQKFAQEEAKLSKEEEKRQSKLAQERQNALQKEMQDREKILQQQEKANLQEQKAQEKALQQNQKFMNDLAKAQSMLDSMKKNNILSPEYLSKGQSKIGFANPENIAGVQKFISEMSKAESSVQKMEKQMDSYKSKVNTVNEKYSKFVPKAESQQFKSVMDMMEKEVDELKRGTSTLNQTGFNSLTNEAKNLSNEIGSIAKNGALKDAEGQVKGLGSAFKDATIKAMTFFGVGNLMSEFSKQMRNAVDYTMQMDKAMTNVSMVTGKTGDELKNITNDFKQLAKEMSSTNMEVMAGAEEMLRAGYDNATTKEMVKQNIVASKISGQDSKTTSEQLIAIKNGYDLQAESIEHVNDVLMTLDNNYSTSFAEIAKILQYSSFSAKAVGVEFEELASTATVISSKTRLSAESIGNALKTAYTRFSAVKQGLKEDEEGYDISNLEAVLKEQDIQLRSNIGTFRDYNDVMKDLGAKIDTMSQVDQSKIFGELFGTRQINIGRAMVENLGEIEQAELKVAESAGSSSEAFDKYEKSLEAQANRLKQSFETMYEKMLSSETLGNIIGGLNNLLNTLMNLDSRTVKTGLAFVTTFVAMTKAFKTFNAVMAGEKVTGLLASMIKQMIAVQASATAGAGGLAFLSTGFAGLATAIKGATVSALAFMATPLGMALTALTVVLGGLTYAFFKHRQEQQAFDEAVSKNVESIKTLDDAISSMDSGQISSAIDTSGFQEKQDALQAKIAEIKSVKEELESLREQTNNFQGIDPQGMDETSAKVMELTNKLGELNQEVGRTSEELRASGIEFNGVTGEIYALTEAKNSLAMSNATDIIAKETQAIVNNADEIRNLYNEYIRLSQIENQSAQEKERLSQVINALKGYYSGLTTTIDNNGNSHITNIGLIENTISAMDAEGKTIVNVAEAHRLAMEQMVQVEVNGTRQTIAQIRARIDARNKEKALNGQNFSGRGGYMSGSEREEYEAIADWNRQMMEMEKDLANLGSIGAGSVGGGGAGYTSATKPSGGGSSASKAKQADIKSETDAYVNLKNAIAETKHQIDLLEIAEKNANNEDKINYYNQEINLLKQKERQMQDYYNAMASNEQSMRNSLMSKGLVNADGTTNNWKFEELLNWANAPDDADTKKARQEEFKELESLYKKWSDLRNNNMKATERDIKNVTNEIIDAQKKIEEIRKKEFEERKKQIQDEIDRQKKAIEEVKNARIKAIDEAQRKYNEANDEEDYKKDIDKERRKLQELQTLRANAMKDSSALGRARLKELENQIAEQERILEEKYQNKAREDENKQFEEEKRQIENNADAQIKLLENATKALGDTLQEEFVKKLIAGKNEVKEIVNILSQFGIKTVADLKNPSVIDTSAYRVLTNVENTFKAIKDYANSDGIINKNQPIQMQMNFTMNGDLDPSIVNKFKAMAGEISTTMTNALEEKLFQRNLRYEL